METLKMQWKPSRVFAQTYCVQNPWKTLNWTVFLLTSGDPKCHRHATETATMFGDLGFEVVPIAGFTQSDWPSIMEANVPETARKGHLAWLMCFLPKLLSLTQRANKSGQWLIAEDSAWPATFATPTNINKYVAKHGNCWLGYRSSMSNGKLPRCSLPHKLDNNGRITTTRTSEKQLIGSWLIGTWDQLMAHRIMAHRIMGSAHRIMGSSDHGYP